MSILHRILVPGINFTEKDLRTTGLNDKHMGASGIDLLKMRYKEQGEPRAELCLGNKEFSARG